MDVPLETNRTIAVTEGGLALVQALSIILCGKRAKNWTSKIVDRALKAHEDAIAERVVRRDDEAARTAVEPRACLVVEDGRIAFG